MLAGGKGGYGICSSCLVSDLLARGSSLPDKQGVTTWFTGRIRNGLGFFGFLVGPVRKLPTPTSLLPSGENASVLSEEELCDAVC